MPELKLTRLNRKLTSWELLDPSLRPAPLSVNPWSMYCAWCFDWLFAFAVASLALRSWMSFMLPLGVEHLGHEALGLIGQYGKAASFILVPVVFFGMNFLALMLRQQTFGQRLFKHLVISSQIQHSFLWAWGATVSSMLLGLPLVNGWLDHFSQAEARSELYHYWLFSQVPSTEWKTIDLVTLAENNSTQTQKEETLPLAA